jgi:hypothetical protein
VVRKLREYTIATFLEALTDDDIEKKLIQLIAKGLTGEELLEQLLETLEKEK